MRRRIVEFIDDALKPTSDRYTLMNTMAKSALIDVNRNGGDLLANLYIIAGLKLQIIAVNTGYTSSDISSCTTSHHILLNALKCARFKSPRLYN
jgi:ribosomal protein S8E